MGILWNDNQAAASEEAQDNSKEQQEGEKQRSIRDLSDEELRLEYADAQACYKKRANSDTTRRLAIARREMRRRQLPEA
jgi:hypothetical protein